MEDNKIKFKPISTLLTLGFLILLGACQQPRSGNNETQQPTSLAQQNTDNRTQPDTANNDKKETDQQRDASERDHEDNQNKSPSSSRDREDNKTAPQFPAKAP